MIDTGGTAMNTFYIIIATAIVFVVLTVSALSNGHNYSVQDIRNTFHELYRYH
jgi:hypothetical protein